MGAGPLGESSQQLESSRQLGDIHAWLQESRQEKLAKRTIAISNVNGSVFEAIREKAGLVVEFEPNLDLPYSKKVPAFEWGKDLERSQAGSYITHLKTFISLGNEECTWIDAANSYQQLLTTNAITSLGRNFRGTTDVAVCDRRAVDAKMPAAGLHLLFKLKKSDISSSNISQAMASLLLANLHSAQWRPMMVRIHFSYHIPLVVWSSMQNTSVSLYMPASSQQHFQMHSCAACRPELMCSCL